MSVPSWVTALALGQWFQIPGTDIASVNPSPPTTPGNEGPSAKINDWTSFVVDTRNSKVYSVASGGHQGYSGNEVDALSLEQEVPSWAQVLAPTPSASVADAEHYLDGRPASRHQYYGVTLDIPDNRIMLWGGARWFGGQINGAVDSYNIGANSYNPAGTHASLPSPIADWLGAGYLWSTTMIPTSGDVIFANVGGSLRWNRATNNYTVIPGIHPIGYYTMSAFDTQRNRLLVCGGGDGDRHVYTVATGVWTTITPTGPNAANVTALSTGAMVYVAALDAYLVRDANAGGTVYKIDAGTFNVTTYVTTGGGAIPVTLNGPFNKFLYVPNLGGVVYCPVYGGNTWFLRTDVVVTSSGMAGAVDSSLMDRHEPTKNGVYLFNGSNNTAGTPAYIAPAMQVWSTYQYIYGIHGVTPGAYTIAVTRDSGVTFVTQANISISGEGTHDFAALNTIQVGPGRTFTHPNQVVGSAPSGAVIAIDAGTYTNVQGVWTQNKLTFRGIGGKARMRAANPINNQKATWVTQGTDTRVEDIEFSDAAVPDFNGCGIRIEGADIAICRSYFHDNEGGLLGNDGVGNILVEFSEFDLEGNCTDPSACSHHVYFGHNTRSTVQFCYFHNGFEGHLIKSRSQENRILYNRLMDEITGASSYQINLTNGGLSYVIGNLIQKGINSQNSGAMVTYGENGLTNPSTQLYLINNTLVNDLGSNLVTYVQVQAGAANAVIENNLFVSATNRTIATGPNTQTTNLQTATPNFFDRTNYDYRPTPSTPGIGQGTVPGVAGSYTLTPAFQYVHPLVQQARPSVGAIDIGAYQYNAFMPIIPKGSMIAASNTPVLKNNNIENPGSGALALAGSGTFLNGNLGQTPATGALAFVATKPSLNFTGVQFPLTGAATLAGIAPTAKQGTVVSPQSGTLSASTTAPAVASATFRLVGGVALLLTPQSVILGSAGAIAVNQGQAVFTGGAGPTLTFISLIVPPAGAMVASGTQASVIVKPPTSIEVPTGELGLQGASPDIFIPLAARLTFTTFAPLVLSTQNRRPTLSGAVALEGNHPVVVSTHSKPRRGPRAILHLLPMLRQWF